MCNTEDPVTVKDPAFTDPFNVLLPVTFNDPIVLKLDTKLVIETFDISAFVEKIVPDVTFVIYKLLIVDFEAYNPSRITSAYPADGRFV